MQSIYEQYVCSRNNLHVDKMALLKQTHGSGGSRALLLGGLRYHAVSKSALTRAAPRGIWGHAPPENFLDSKSSEMGSSAIGVCCTVGTTQLVR